MRKPILEVCVDSLESALAAVKGNADRLEVCSNLIIGGTSANPFLVKMIKEQLNIRVHALIRPRFGDFYYSESEFLIMQQEILQLKEAGCEGIVTGILNSDGTLDLNRMEKLIETAKGMSVTLHRAFDMCRNPLNTLEESKEIGITGILTSGQQNSALEGIECLYNLMQQSQGTIEIMAGGGIDISAIKEIEQKISLPAYHMSGKKTVESRMLYRNKKISMGPAGISEYINWQTDEEKVKRAAEYLTQMYKNLS